MSKPAGSDSARIVGPVGETRWLEPLPFGSAGKKLGAIVAHADSLTRAWTTLAAHLAAVRRCAASAMASHHPASGVMRWSKAAASPRHCVPARLRKLAASKLRADAWV
jgi:hypothetical protein